MVKIEFIEKLLKHKNLSRSQRDRIISLALNEFKKDGLYLDGIMKRIERIEGVIEKSKNTTNVVQTKHPKKKGQLSIGKNLTIPIKVHSPKEMVKFLFQFSTNDSFKWFTHKPDLRVDNINYLNLLDNFKKFKLPHSLNYATIMFIKSFFQKKPNSNSSKFHIYFPEFSTNLTYSNYNVLEELKKGINPFDVMINDNYFVDVINRFKHAIEFRLDIDKFNFFSLFTEFISNKLSIDISEEYTENFYNNSSSLTTYIDINNFFRGLETIINWINDYKMYSNSLLIDLIDKDEYYLISLYHKESRFNCNVNNPKLSGLSGDFNILRKYWFSVVDFEIHTDLKDGKSCEIICLNNKTTIKNTTLSENDVIETPENKIGGIKYLIKIYKNI